MARYVTLIRFTAEGAKTLKKSPARARAFAKSARKAGVTVESQLWTLGSCDGVLILSGNEKKILSCLAQLGSRGNVRTETLQAFDAKELGSLLR